MQEAQLINVIVQKDCWQVWWSDNAKCRPIL